MTRVGPAASILVLALLQTEGSEPPATPVVPAVTDDQLQARQLLEDFQARLYDPVAEGLESLAFDVVLPAMKITKGQSAGVLHVSWMADRGTVAELEVADFGSQRLSPGLQDTLAVMAQQMVKESRMAEMLVQAQLNGMLREILESSSPRVQGLQGDLVRVICTPLPDSPGSVANRVLRFDAEGRPVEQVVVEKDGFFSGPGRRRIESVLTWVALPGPSGKLVLGSRQSTDEAGVEPDDGETVVYEREDVGGFWLITSVRTLLDEPEPQLPEGKNLTFENFAVNGVAVEGR